MVTKLTIKQRAARMSVLFQLTEPLTPEEQQAVDLPFAEWPQSLKDKSGPLGQMVEAEDIAAAAAPSQE